MTRVLALDLSATKAGVANPDGTTHTMLAPALSTPVEPDDLCGRLSWWHSNLAGLIKVHRPDIVAVEDYFLRGPNRRTLTTTAEVVGHAMCLTARARAAYWRVTAEDLKGWATGDRRAGKDAMVAAASARGWRCSSGGYPDDEADAYLLRSYVLERVA